MTGRTAGASRLAIIFVAATGLFPHAARAAAQRPEAKPPQKATPPSAGSAGAPAFDPVRERALEVVGLEINRAKRYGQPRNSVRVWTAAAETLWDYDAEAARKTLREAFALVGRAEAPPRDGEKESVRAVRNHALRNELRTDILALAQRRDPALARELIESVREDGAAGVAAAKSEPLRFGSASTRRAGLAQLAARLAERDPAAALDYATQSLGQGVPSELQTVFLLLLKSDPQAARELFRRAVESLEADPAANHFDVLFVAFYVQTAPAEAVDPATAARLFAAAHERVLRVWQRAVEAGRPDPGLVSSLTMTVNTLVPLARRYSAETGDKLYNLGRQVAQDVAGSDKKADELYQSGQGPMLDQKDPDAVLARAERETNEEERDALYFLAAVVLWQKGEIERALSAAGRARPTEKRGSVLDLIRASHARDLVSKGEFTDALKVLELVTDVEARADVTVALVTAARRKGQAEMARGVISDMQRLLDKEKGSARHARTFLWLAAAYAQLDPAAGFELMGSAVKLANTVHSFEETKPEQRHVILGGYVREAFLVGDAKADFRTGFRTLARLDLQRTVELAEGFQSEIFRGLALVAAADAALKKSQDAGRKPAADAAPTP